MTGVAIGEVIGAWRLDAFLGSGGMGDVYRASRIDGVVGQVAALKILRGTLEEHLEEADAIRPLRHPNIARCFDSGCTPRGQRYFVMEYVDGCAITAYADRNGLTIHERLELFAAACSAVEHAHRHVLLHLDVKPANILVNGEGVVKLIDFGIARRIGCEPSGAAPFSGPYSGPELVEGEPAGYETDVYGLGAVLYELLSGHPPFDPLLPALELERQIREEKPRPPSDALNHSTLQRNPSGRLVRMEPHALAHMRGAHRLSEVRRLVAGDLDRICLFALRKNPAARYRSPNDFRCDIESVLRGRRPGIARSGDPFFSALNRARRRPIPLLAVGAIATALLGFISSTALFSESIAANVESEHRQSAVAEKALAELRRQLRPRVATDPHTRACLREIDRVLRLAAPVPHPTSALGESLEQLLPPCPEQEGMCLHDLLNLP
jgi:serine/threonine protein kinase